ncbi:hypothetical protein AAHA92_16741 [Salvia divinorum]|uniref:Uncharacterized protein n=1 Tax=Salvia divinorum TaxID=28513 RepID=A0ABD1GWI3_SALDI
MDCISLRERYSQFPSAVFCKTDSCSCGQGCSLHQLNVSGCHQIGDAGIIAIARRSPDLNSLDISVLQNMGYNSIYDGTRKCTLLESCHMVYCPGITEAGVATIVATCTRLKNILVEKWKVNSRTKRRAGSIISYLCVDL